MKDTNNRDRDVQEEFIGSKVSKVCYNMAYNGGNIN
jgi:hypothetical protein